MFPTYTTASRAQEQHHSHHIRFAPWVDHGSWEAELELFPPLAWTCDSDLKMHNTMMLMQMFKLRLQAQVGLFSRSSQETNRKPRHRWTQHMCKNNLYIDVFVATSLAWNKGESHAVYPCLHPALPLGPLPVPLALGEGNVHLELDGLLEDGRAAGRFVLCPEAGLGEDAVAERRDLRGGETEKKQKDQQTYEAGEVRGRTTWV